MYIPNSLSVSLIKYEPRIREARIIHVCWNQSNPRDKEIAIHRYPSTYVTLTSTREREKEDSPQFDALIPFIIDADDHVARLYGVVVVAL